MDLKNNLEAKIVRLEEKVAHQESLLIALQTQQAISSSQSVSDDIVERINDNRNSGKSFVLRTCRETRAADPSLGSGMYWIDPDGQGVGDDPIYVFCNMPQVQRRFYTTAN